MRTTTTPLWAMAYYTYARATPEHRGKGRLLGAMHNAGLRSARRFVWRMANGSLLVLDPREGLIAGETVGWTCFLERRWEPHVESFLRAELAEGDYAIDVGANIGYFSAVMCQSVGASGRVTSFEPVPVIRECLLEARRLNQFDQLEVLPFALADREHIADIQFDDRLAGSSSLHRAPTPQAARHAVQVKSLDRLMTDGSLPCDRLRLVKIDVEGAELSVLRGAVEMISTYRPTVVFELNGSASSAAGWGADDVTDFFSNVGGYRLSRLQHERLDTMPRTPLEPDEYIDVVAQPVTTTRVTRK